MPYAKQLNINELQNRNTELTQEYTQAETDLQRLQHQSDYINTDNYVENTAREQFGLTYEGEIKLEPSE
jgi:cell division protein FtsB